MKDLPEYFNTLREGDELYGQRRFYETGQFPPLAFHIPSLRYWRCKRGFTMRKLSELSGIPYSTLNKMQMGTHLPNALNLANIAHVLNVPLEEFFVFRGSTVPIDQRYVGCVSPDFEDKRPCDSSDNIVYVDRNRSN